MTVLYLRSISIGLQLMSKRKFPKRHGTNYFTETVVYCNSHFQTIAFYDNHITKLHRVHNCIYSFYFAFMVSAMAFYPLSIQLCIITYQECSRKYIIHAPLTPVRKPIQLRSYNSDLLFVSKVYINICIRAYYVAASILWNMLPFGVRSVETID